MGKRVISIDLNPMSRTSRAAHVAIVDEVGRAMMNLARFVGELRDNASEAERLTRSYDKVANMKVLYAFLDWRLQSLKRGVPPSSTRSRAARRGRA